MRKIISACLVIAIVSWAHVGGRNNGAGSEEQRLSNLAALNVAEATSNLRAEPRISSSRVRRHLISGVDKDEEDDKGPPTKSSLMACSSAPDSEGLILMRQEEKLARDVYLTLGEQWNLPIFAHIAKAESRHMAAVGSLLARYNLPDPVANDIRGQFPEQRFNELYQDLIAAGSRSAAEAARVGVQIEELDIADLQSELKTVRQEDIRKVYLNLLKGSRQHLRAFTAQLK